MTKTLKIQPIDLVDLTVTTDNYAYTLADFTVSGGFLVGEIDATLTVTNVTISSSGYASQSFMYRNLPSEVVLVAQEVEILSDGTNRYQIADKVARAELSNKADISDIPTKTSDLSNDSGYITGITSSDVTTALGYTPADDDDVVKTSGNQAIDGQKTFLKPINYEGNQALASNFIHDRITKGTAPSSNALVAISMVDSNFSGIYNNTIARTQYAYLSSGATQANLQVFKPELDSTANASISIIYPASGNPYTEAPTPTEDTTSSTQIDTVGARNTKLQNYALDNAVVKLTGGQDVGGIKNFTDKIVRKHSQQSAFSSVSAQVTAITKGTNPTTATEGRWFMTDSRGDFGNAYSIAGMLTGFSTSGTTSAILVAFKSEANSTSNARLGIYYPASGSAYTEAPTPASSDNSTKIATTAYVHNFFAAISGYDATKTQTLKNVNGTLTWVTD